MIENLENQEQRTFCAEVHHTCMLHRGIVLWVIYGGALPDTAQNGH